MSGATGWRGYLALVSARFRSLLQYRAAAAAGACTQVVWGFMRIMIFAAFYRSSSARHPMTFAEVVDYVWLGQAFFAMMPWRPDRDILQRFRSGDVARDLLRPWDLYGHWYARNVAFLSAPALIRCIPVFAVAFLASELRAPASVAAGLAWAAATVGALILGCALLTTLTCTCFWTVAGEGAVGLNMATFMMFSGMVIPLPLFPESLQPILQLLPYASLVDTPLRLWAGHLPPGAVGEVLLHQAVWTLLLVGLGRWLVARGHRHLLVQGG